MKTAIALGMAFGLSGAAAAVTVPNPLRNDTPVTGNKASFTNDASYAYWDTDGTATTPNLGNGQQAGWLAQNYNLTPVQPPLGSSNSVLPQLERAMVEFRAGGSVLGDANRTYGVFVPNSTTGLPVSQNGTGVHSSLNTGGSLNADSSTVNTAGNINVPWQNFLQSNGADQVTQPPPVVFSISRIGSNFSVQITDSNGSGSHSWSASGTNFLNINAIQLRLEAGGTSAWRVTDLRYNGDLMNPTANSGATGLVQADNITGNAFTNREIFLWDQVNGDFTLTGNIYMGWLLGRPSNDTANARFSFLSLRNGGIDPFSDPDPIPEPSSWAMLIAGFGLVGAMARRRRRTLA